VLAAVGQIREIDFDLLVTLASLAASASVGLERRSENERPAAADANTTDPLDDALQDASAVGEDHEADAGPSDGTLALSTADLELLRGGSGLGESPAAAASLRLADWERLLAIEALRRTGGSVPEAAALLGISRATLYRRLDAYGFTQDGSPAQD
jgi:transcriptional regulator of acetoin/glycerol metabolism